MKLRDFAFLVIGLALGGVIGLLASGDNWHKWFEGDTPRMAKKKGMQDFSPGPNHGQPQVDRTEEMRKKVEELQQELAKNPGSFEHLVQLANTYFDMENTEKAIEFYQKALAISDKDVSLLNDLGICLQKLGRLDEAVAQFQKARTLNPLHWQSIYNTIVVKVNQKKGAEEVRSEYQALMKIVNKDAKLPFGIGMNYFETSNFDEAIFYFNETLSLEANHYSCINYLAQSYERTKKFTEAAATYEQLVKMLPEGHGTAKILRKIQELRQASGSNQPQPKPEEKPPVTTTDKPQANTNENK